jgi:hypothetical protein
MACPNKHCGAAVAVPPYSSPTHDIDLSPGDWLVCIFFSPVGVIAGLIRLAQGNGSGWPMIAYSILFACLAVALSVVAALLNLRIRL